MKGIILAGGRGTRLHPVTKGVSKQLLPIYDKPLIYYPLSVLMMAGIREILIISTPEDTLQYEKLLGTGAELGLDIQYKLQKEPRGLAEAFILGEDFIASDNKQDGVCLILGDNVFHGQYFGGLVRQAKERVQTQGGAAVFGYPVTNPSDFGVISFDETGKALDIVEKPAEPKSNYAVPGLYFYDNKVVEIAKNVKPSERGEIEITAINEDYLNRGDLHVTLMGRGMAWLDTGSPDRMHKASSFVASVQEMQGFYVACIEEIAWRSGFITTEQLLILGQAMKNTDYGQYILGLTTE